MIILIPKMAIIKSEKYYFFTRQQNGLKGNNENGKKTRMLRRKKTRSALKENFENNGIKIGR